VTHVARGKGIPPFLILHVAEQPDTSAQALRLRSALREAAVPVSMFSGRDTTHSRINDAIGRAEDPVTKAVFDFVTTPPSR
jgi:arylformamidase